jgi:mannose-6-phosphate isomerase-like protein (cupin superfamily)
MLVGCYPAVPTAQEEDRVADDVDRRDRSPRTASWDVASLDARRRAAGRAYLEFLTVPDLSAGLYVLEAGEEDRQRPHTEDEIYAIVSGRGRLRMGDEDVAVGPGSVAFVAAGIEHRFHDITERLTILVAFGPAEGSRGAG